MLEFMFPISAITLINITQQMLVLVPFCQICKDFWLEMVSQTTLTTALPPMLKWDIGTHFTVNKLEMQWLKITATTVELK